MSYIPYGWDVYTAMNVQPKGTSVKGLTLNCSVTSIFSRIRTTGTRVPQ